MYNSCTGIPEYITVTAWSPASIVSQFVAAVLLSSLSPVQPATCQPGYLFYCSPVYLITCLPDHLNSQMSLAVRKPILEIKRRLDGSRVEFSCQGCLIKPGRHAAVLYTLDRDWHFPQIGLTVPAGSISSGFFWEGKPFNLYHWMTPAGETIGDYFNLVAETTITSDTIEWLDLALDFCIVAGSEGIWLDEDELSMDAHLPLNRLVNSAKNELQSQAYQRSRHLSWFSRSLLY